MGDYDYDPDYMQEDVEIDYPDHYPDADNYGNEDGINYEDMFIEAESANTPDKYLEIIDLEKDNSSDCKWAFKCYEKLCLIYLKEKNLELFEKYFAKLFEIYNKIDDCDKQDTIRNCNFVLSDNSGAGADEEFTFEVLSFMLDLLKEQGVDREVMNTGLQFTRRLFNLGRYEELGNVNIFITSI
jgi:hypothetical protein